MTWLMFLAITASLVALLCLGLAWEIAQILRARVPAFPRTLHVGSTVLADDLAPTIPKIIWTYWHASPAPEFIRHCHDNWRHFAPDHVLHVIDKSTITDWLDAQLITDQFAQLPPFRQADWLRLQLLARHGGIWIDASTLLTQSLEWVHTLQAERGSEYLGFFIDRFTTRPDQPIVENWFMAACPESPFILALAKEFDRALHMGEANYLATLGDCGCLETVVQGLGPKDQLYLIMHVAAAVVLNRDPETYKLALIRAEDSALGFHAALKWRKRHLYARLAMTPAPTRLPCIIKLRGGDRRVFERGLTRGWLITSSALAKLIQSH
jgi:hypothetical protein